MPAITRHKITAAEAKPLLAEYRSELLRPMDDMWEKAFIAFADHWHLMIDGNLVGLLVVDSRQYALVFYIRQDNINLAGEIFQYCLDQSYFRSASPGSSDPLFLGLSLARQRRVMLNTYLYEVNPLAVIEQNPQPDYTFRTVPADEVVDIMHFLMTAIETDQTWLRGYLENLAALQQLYVLLNGPEKLGTGELRVSRSQPPHADIGMIVSPQHRNKGIGTEILLRLKSICLERQLIPICSTVIDNIAAQKAIIRAGFTSRFQIFDIDFQ